MENLKLQQKPKVLRYAETANINKNELTFYQSSYWADSYDNPYNIDPIWKKRSDYSIYDEMRNDDQCKVALSLKKDICLNSGWTFDCEDENKSKDVIDFLYEAFEERIEKSFEQSLREMLTACDFGFSVTEIINKLEDNKYWIKYLKTRAPDTFEIELDPKGNVKHYWQYGPENKIDIPKQNIMHFVYQGEFDNPYGKSDLRAAYSPWFAKKYAQKFFTISLERHASTKVFGKYPANWSEQQKQDFYDHLKGIQFGTVVVAPNGSEIEFPNTPGASEVYKQAIDLYNMQIARSILIPDLLGVGGTETKGGSYALGDIQWNVFLTSLEFIRKDLARKINLCIIRPLLDLNFGSVKEYPKFKFNPLKEEDKQDYLKLWLDAIKSKAFKANEEEVNHFKESIGFPTGPFIEAPEAPNPVFRQAGSEDNPDASSDYKFYTKRQLTSYEKKVSFSEIKTYLEQKNEKSLERGRAILEKMINDFVDQVERQKIAQKDKFDKIKDLDFKYKKELQLYFKNDWLQVYKDSKNQARKELFHVEQFKYQLNPEEKFITALDSESYQYVQGYIDLMGRTGKAYLSNAIKQGVPIREMVWELKERMRDVSFGRLKTAIQTKHTEVYNKARYNYFTQDKDAKEFVEYFQYSAVMDDATTDLCQSLDEKIYKANDPIWNNITPPNHYNCRSIIVPITKFEPAKKSKKVNLDSLRKKSGGAGDFIL